MKKSILSKLLIVTFLVMILVAAFVACNIEQSIHKISFKTLNEKGELVHYSGTKSNGNEIIKFPVNDPKLPGKVFEGWYLDQFYNVEVKEYSYLNKEITEDLVFYAHFIDASLVEDNYVVTFNTLGGADIANKTLKFREKLEEIVPQKAGSEFLGWYLDSTYTIPWNMQYDRVKSNITLFAKWQEIEYSITFDCKNATFSEPIQATYSETKPIRLPAKESVSRPGFIFIDFYEDQTLETIFDVNKTRFGNITIYMKWQAIDYKLNYNIPDGVSFNTSGDEPTTYNLDVGIETINEPTKDGYDFVGWRLNDQNGILLTLQNLPVPQNLEEGITVYPYMKEKEYTITLNLDGGKLVGLPNTTQIKYKHFASEINIPDAQKLGYTFSKWTYLNGEDFNSLYIKREDFSVNANYTINNYSISYNLKYDNAINPNTVSSYTILTYSSITLESATCDGYEFGGWYIDSSCTTKYDKTQFYARDLVLYAGWYSTALLQPNTYDIYPTARTLVVSSSVTNNIAMNFTDGKMLQNVSLNSDEYAIQNNEQTSLLVIKKDVLSNIKEGDKFSFRVTFDNGQVENYYISKTSEVAPIITVNDYDKASTSAFEISFENVINSENIYSVVIDEQKTPYTFNSNKIIIDSALIKKLKPGTHTIQVLTINGISYASFTITSTSYCPYNLSIPIDETYVEEEPKIMVKWDCDAPENATYSVTIMSQVYKQEDYPDLFNGKSFNATGILKFKDQTCKVSAHVNGEEYSATVKMPVSMYRDSSSNTIYEKFNDIFGYKYTFAGERKNAYLTSFEDIYDLIMYAILYPSTFEYKELALNNGDTAWYYCSYFYFDFDISSQDKIDTSTFDTAKDGDIALSNINFVAWLMDYITNYLGEGCDYSMAYGRSESFGFNTTQVYLLGFNFPEVTVDGVNYGPLGKDKPKINRTHSNNPGYSQITTSVEHSSKTGYSQSLLPREVQNKGTASVKSSIEMYLAFEKGYNVVIDPTCENYTALNSMLNKIKNILKQIVDENMNDFEKAIAIYEYLETHIIYDYTIANSSYSNRQLTLFSSFYMEGVFAEEIGLAVCNGIAAAYSTMLNLMNIKAYKIGGLYIDSEDKSVGHAWVVMQIGGLWYLADPTWSNLLNKTDGAEMTSYDYLFIPYTTSYNQGRKVTNVSYYDYGYENDIYIDVYRMLKFEYEGVEYDFVIESSEEMNKLALYMIQEYGAGLQSGNRISCYIKNPHRYSNTINFAGYSFKSNSFNPTGYVILEKQ